MTALGGDFLVYATPRRGQDSRFLLENDMKRIIRRHSSPVLTTFSPPREPRPTRRRPRRTPTATASSTSSEGRCVDAPVPMAR